MNWKLFFVNSNRGLGTMAAKTLGTLCFLSLNAISPPPPLHNVLIWLGNEEKLRSKLTKYTKQPGTYSSFFTTLFQGGRGAVCVKYDNKA